MTSLDSASPCNRTITSNILLKQSRSFQGQKVGCFAKSITHPSIMYNLDRLPIYRMAQSPNLNPIEHQTPQKQTGTEDGCRTGWAEHHQRIYRACGDVYGLQISASHRM